jgi:hypothetical protein
MGLPIREAGIDWASRNHVKYNTAFINTLQHFTAHSTTTPTFSPPSAILVVGEASRSCRYCGAHTFAHGPRSPPLVATRMGSEAQVVAMAKAAPASPAPMLYMKKSMPPSPVADEPDEPPPRCAVVSEDTKTFDRGRRKGDHTHTHTPVSC